MNDHQEVLLDIPDLACPSCHRPLVADGAGWRCAEEKIRFPTEDGIPNLLLPGRLEALQEFLTTYQRIRKTERWGTGTAEYYRQLPHVDQSGAHPSIWKIRARTFDFFLRHFTSQVQLRQVRCLDIGAGNCWLSARLAALGHSVVALDINLDPLDGLRALSIMPLSQRSRVVPIQADFAALPFGSESFDIVVFNGSLHYSPDIMSTLSAAMNVLRRQGVLYILDSPIYSSIEAGEQMIQEQKRSHAALLGTDMPERRARGYLTESAVREMESKYRTEVIVPSYGLRWRLRPAVASVLGRREPASFRIIAVHKD